MLGKALLPDWGGVPAVWTACPLFFQSGLLLGYLYAFALSRWLTLTWQVATHGACLVATIACLPIAIVPGAEEASTAGDPTKWILLRLVIAFGAPYVALAATAPLFQYWHGSIRTKSSPYWLYAASNLGSFVGLFAYPFLVELFFPISQQFRLWSIGYAVFALLGGVIAVRIGYTHAAPAVETHGPRAQWPSSKTESIRGIDTVLWLLLSANGSIMLLATSNRMCQEVAPMPFLWVWPLSIYLLTYAVCFLGERWYDRRWAFLAFASALLASVLLWWPVLLKSLVAELSVLSGILAATSFVCHGELYRRRPRNAQAPYFYLLLALGGAAGGAFVSLAAPRIFAGYYEFHLGLFCPSNDIGFWAAATVDGRRTFSDVRAQFLRNTSRYRRRSPRCPARTAPAVARCDGARLSVFVC
jgi:hypothetical protein